MYACRLMPVSHSKTVSREVHKQIGNVKITTTPASAFFVAITIPLSTANKNFWPPHNTFSYTERCRGPKGMCMAKKAASSALFAVSSALILKGMRKKFLWSQISFC